jgi:uncharacterized membrane protein YfhO
LALLASAFIIYKDFIFGDKIFLFKDIGSDTINGVYPMIVQNAKIWNNQMNGWSFHSGMGQNVMGYFLREPFEFFLYGLDPKGIAQGMGWLEFIKVILTGTFFYLFLKEMVQHKISAAIGAFLFTFSGYVILGGCWCLFSFEAMNLALLLYAAESMLKGRRHFLFAIGIFLIGISQPFNLYVYGLFLLTYIVMRMFVLQWNLKQLIPFVVHFAIYGIVGLCASAYFLTPQIFQILESPRGSGNSSYTDVLQKAPMFATGDATLKSTTALRFFSNDILGTGNDFKGWTNYLEAPLLYVGIFSLILFPQIFVFSDKRNKIIYGAFLAFWFLPLVFPWFRYAFWLFSGDYFRAFSYFAAFPLVLFTALSLDQIFSGNKINSGLHFGWIVFLLLICSINYTSVKVDSSMASYVKILILSEGLIVFLISSRKFYAYTTYALLLILFLEAAAFSYITVNNRTTVKENELDTKIGYNDFTNDAVEFIKKTDPSFFRIDKGYYSGPAMHGSLNDAVIQNYFGTCCYNSFNNINYVTFMQSMGIIKEGNEVESRWIPGLMGRPILENLCAVKYLLFKGVLNEGIKYSYDSLASFNDVKVVRSRYAMPLGITYDTIIGLTDFKKLKPPVSDIVLMKACLFNDETNAGLKNFNVFNIKDTSSAYGWDQLARDVKQRKQDTLTVNAYSQSEILGSIQLNKNKILFLSFPYDEGWQAYDNNKPIKLLKAMNGLCGMALNAGTHQIKLQYQQRLRSESLYISCTGIFLALALPLFQRYRSRSRIKVQKERA